MHDHNHRYMTTIQARIDGKTKKKVQKILKSLGLDLSSAIHLYFMQVIKHGGIPFPILLKINDMKEKATNPKK